ncbi:MAG TPA: holo-ACP synthase [Puia sp.]|nr:holo-ACP synthase [Puia sp.]
MIIGIGCDVVDHETTKNLGWSSNLHMLQRIFSAHELKLFEAQRNDRFISGRYAAKEAVLKCLGTGMRDGTALTEIQILQAESGQAVIQIGGEAEELARQLGINTWHISISHTPHSSTAFVVAEG